MNTFWDKKSCVGILIALLIGSVIAGSAYFYFEIYSSPLAPITLCVPKFPTSTLIFVAKEERLFEKEGLDVKIRTYGTGRNCLTQLQENLADLVVAYSTPTVQVLKSEDLVILSEIHRSNNNTALLYHSDRFGDQVEPNLRGKKVGVVAKSNADFLLSLYLMIYSVDRKEIDIQYFSREEIGRQFLKGNLDAAMLWEPDVSKFQNANPRIKKASTNFYTEISMLSSKRSWIKTHTKETQALIRALNKAYHFHKHSPDRTRTIVSNWLHMDPLDITRAWLSMDFEMGLTHVLSTLLAEESKWIAQIEETEPPAQLLVQSFFDPTFLDAVTPETVTYR